MAKKSISKGVIKDIAIVAIGVLVIAIALNFIFAGNPFYVVASGSMIPELLIYDVIIVQGGCFDLFGFLDSKSCIKLDSYSHFEDIEVGDIIVFDRPSDHDRVIVHRVSSILDEDPKTIRTKGDANPASIPGTDFPITEEEYIGKVAYIIPQVGYVTQILKPPVNYVLIAIVIGFIVLKEIRKNKEESKPDFAKSSETESQELPEEVNDINKIEKDTEYSEIDSPEIKEQELSEEVNNAQEDSENKLDETNEDSDEKSEDVKK